MSIKQGSPAVWWLPVVALVMALLISCEGERTQSMLHPAGPAADRIAVLWWVMFAVYGVVFVLTLLILGAGLVLPRREKTRLGSRFVVVAGVLIPTLILTLMLIYTVDATRADKDQEPAMRVQVIGHQWWWEVRYLDHGVVDANEIHIPAGQVVELELLSADVIHSLWIPNLAGKMDMLPEHPNVLRVQADKPGIFRGQCAEFCGTQHARMALRVIAHEPEQMQAWLADRQQEPAVVPDVEKPLQGQQVFASAGCAACHRIEGVSTGQAGPDLSRLGSRLTIGSGVFDNTRENLDRWIQDPHLMKPGVLMPPTQLSDADREALVTYLRSLK